MKAKLRKNGFFRVLLKMNMLPVIILTLVITTFSAARFATSMSVEVKDGLVNMCQTVITLYDTAYQGDYHVVDQDGTVYMMKGDQVLNGDDTIVDSIKEKTGVDITIFCRDTRVITTIQTGDHVRAIGTKANDTVIEDVLKGGHPQFYTSTIVEGVQYFSYYEPLYASDGTCIGMIFLGKPSAEVEKLVFDSLNPIITFGILTMLVVCFVTVQFSNKLVTAIRTIEAFVANIAKGELHTGFDDDVLNRKDELGDMSRYLIRMQKALQNLVEQDILTGLYNRRSGENLLRRTSEKYRGEGIPFCVALGDIDHFKRVNDTYGHECGDVALIEISARVKEHMKGKGFAARWGGEELLVVYENMQLEEAAGCMEELREDICTRPIVYGDTALNITMTFGITEGNAGKIEHMIRDADEKLYEGKNSGRNRIVYEGKCKESSLIDTLSAEDTETDQRPDFRS